MTTIQVFHANEDGTAITGDIPIRLTSDLQFTMVLPEYVATFLDVSPTIEADSALKAGAIYEKHCDDYSKRRLTIGDETALLLSVDICSAHPGSSAVLAMDLMRVSTYTDSDGVIQCIERMPDGTLGRRIDPSDGRLVADTPEIEAKAIALINSLAAAVEIMKGFMQTTEPQRYRMEISNDWNAAKENCNTIPDLKAPDDPAPVDNDEDL